MPLVCQVKSSIVLRLGVFQGIACIPYLAVVQLFMFVKNGLYIMPLQDVLDHTLYNILLGNARSRGSFVRWVGLIQTSIPVSSDNRQTMLGMMHVSRQCHGRISPKIAPDGYFIPGVQSVEEEVLMLCQFCQLEVVLVGIAGSRIGFLGRSQMLDRFFVWVGRLQRG